MNKSAHKTNRPSQPEAAEPAGGTASQYQNIPVMLFTLDDHGVILSVNPFGAHQLGYEPHQLVGQSVFKVFHPQDRQVVEQQFASCLENRDRVAGWEFRKVRKDGSILWVKETVRAVVGPDQRTQVLVACQDVTEKKLVEQTVLAHEEHLRTLTSALSLAEERERRRISMGLHDRIGSNLAVVQAKLTALRRSSRAAEVDRCLDEGLEQIANLVSDIIQATRSFIFELSSPILYDFGLEAALHDLGERTFAENGADFEFKADSHPRPLTDDTRIVLFRAVRELLLNIRKHAHASHVQLTVGRVADQIGIRLEDDGVGFDASEVGTSVGPNGGFGLFSIREQLNEVGGRVEIESVPGQGTCIVLRAPLRLVGDPS